MSKSKNHDVEAKGTGHVYDGIEELDHAPPYWFTALFYATIVFGIGYFVHYTLGQGPSIAEEYQKSRQADEYAQYQRLKQGEATGLPTEDELRKLVQDPNAQSLGSSVYQAKCAACHGSHGQGGIGPNLTDEYWLHGGKMTEILKVVSKGVPEKGMPPWEPILKTEEIHALTAYIRKMAGSNPAGAKAPQGDLVKPE